MKDLNNLKTTEFIFRILDDYKNWDKQEMNRVLKELIHINKLEVTYLMKQAIKNIDNIFNLTHDITEIDEDKYKYF